MTSEHSEGAGRAIARAERSGVVRLGDLDLSRAFKVLGRDAGAAGVRSAADLQRVVDDLCALSMRDPLTGLFNRRYFDHRLVQEVARARRERVPCALALLDVDHFKRVNDRFGHTAGDAVLAHVAQVLLAELRTADTLTRVGGEELAVILPHTGIEAAVGVAERLRRAVTASPTAAGGEAITVTLSAGVAATTPGDAAAPQDLYRRADQALYAAKQAGRNRVRADAPARGDREGVGADEKKALTT